MSPLIANYVIPLILTIVGVLIFVLVLTACLKNASEKTKLLPIKIVLILLWVMEIAKIFYLIGKDNYFNTNRYPIVFCSLVMFSYPVFVFGNNKFSEIAKAFSVVPAILVFAMFAGYQWNYPTMSIIQAHSFFYHGSMLAVAIYMLCTKLYTFKFRHFYPLSIVLSGYIVFCIVLSLFIGGDISIFGPTALLKPVYDMFGYAVGNILLCIAMFILGFGFYGIVYLCKRKKDKKTQSKEDLGGVKNV